MVFTTAVPSTVAVGIRATRVDAIAVQPVWPKGLGCLGSKIRRTEIVFASDADQGEQRISPCIGQCRPHAPRIGGLGNLADRPVGRDPFARGMRQGGGQVHKPRTLIDGRCLDGRDLMLTQGLAHDVEPADNGA